MLCLFTFLLFYFFTFTSLFLLFYFSTLLLLFHFYQFHIEHEC